MLSILGKKISRQHFEIFFPENRLKFHAENVKAKKALVLNENCLLKAYFWERYEKYHQFVAHLMNLPLQ